MVYSNPATAPLLMTLTMYDATPINPSITFDYHLIRAEYVSQALSREDSMWSLTTLPNAYVSSDHPSLFQHISYMNLRPERFDIAAYVNDLAKTL